MKLAFSIVLTLMLVVVVLALSCGPSEPTQTIEPTTPSQPQAEVFNWRFSSMGTPATVWHYNTAPWAEQFEALSGGRVTVKTYSVGELFAVTDSLDNLSRGTVEMASVTTDYSTGAEPRFYAMVYYPGAPVRTLDEVAMFVNNTNYIDLVSKVYADHDIHYAGTILSQPEIFMSKVPIRGLEDFQGLKVRGSGPSQMLFEELGASATYIPTAEVYTAAQLGTVDCLEISDANSNLGLGLHEVTDYIISPVLHCPWGLLDLVVNEEAYNSLPMDLQQLCDSMAVKTGLEYWYKGQYENIAAQREMVEKHGIEIIELPQEDVIAAFQKGVAVWDEVAAMGGAESKQVIAELKDFCAYLGYELP
jgi:TRAP-type mannitol/chloroaromatic compound transport system substrate-binding protein